MRIEVLKDVTITVKAGQSVEVSPEQAALAIRLGFAREVIETKAAAPKKTVKKK